MRFIGITGGVGCGKSKVLEILKEQLKDKCIIVEADKLAASLMMPGHKCFDDVVSLPWPSSIIGDDGLIDRSLMAKFMYADHKMRNAVNEIVHPAVKLEIQHQVDEAYKTHNIEYFFYEAALLIECGYDKLCDELWYIYADEAVRRDRLSCNRGYSQDKISSIMASQLPEDVFKDRCSVVIDNSGDAEVTRGQILSILA
ncbi:MAG: dephospho-CoA kinase [Pseudobutyrivibrio sp.]|nr:dephospho-CoA kinase [Pseudobutyrivibrio sp.]